MKRRMVILSIDTICNLFKDYVGLVGFPQDGKPVKFMLNPQERKLGLVVESEEWTGPQKPEEIKFDLRRVFSIGGVS
jgi:hypothetical protein